MGWRSLPNGDKFAPQKGVPPEPPEGYCIDSKNPFLAHPILKACQYRFIAKETLSCGKVLGIIECSHPSKNNIVNQLICFRCLTPNPLDGDESQQVLFEDQLASEETLPE